MTGRKIHLDARTKIENGKIINPKPKPRDASQKKRWATSKKIRVAKRGRLNSIGKT